MNELPLKITEGGGAYSIAAVSHQGAVKTLYLPSLSVEPKPDTERKPNYFVEVGNCEGETPTEEGVSLKTGGFTLTGVNKTDNLHIM